MEPYSRPPDPGGSCVRRGGRVVGDGSVQAEIDRYAALFDTIERSPLTHEQRIAAVTMAHRNLLIAAAGSGKTSSMVGKVAYALSSGLCRADQILVLAFNRKAALELDVRLRRSLAPLAPDGIRVKTRTLHALGLDIIKQVKGYRPRIHQDGTGLLHRVLARLVQDDASFAERWLLFRVFHHVPVRFPGQFRTRKQWKAFVRQYGACRGGRWGFITLRGEHLPTQFEQAVANWLYLHQIDYVYTSVRPWFDIRSRLAELILGPLSGQNGFVLTALHHRLVCVSPTTARCVRPDVITMSTDAFCSGRLFDDLRDRLGICGVRLKRGRLPAIFARLGHRLTPGQTEFLLRFIRIARLNGTEPGELAARAPDSADPVRTSMHAPMLAQLLSAYSAALDHEEAIDFEGMLHRAADDLDAGRYRHAYTLVLVDEFQDTSQAGLRLLKSLLAQNTECMLFAVGDDWQSIYRFAGAVPDVLNRFENHFGASTVNRLTATFRFNQSIADAASRFVQANPAQLRKDIRARADSADPSIILARYATAPHMFALCELCLQDCIAAPVPGASESGDHRGGTASVYILGRYQHQRPPDLDRWRTCFPQLDIQYQTVHAAKGLEADIVIVLGLAAGRHGFPAELTDDALISLVMPDVEHFPCAEERRLFYVAMTRCRHRVYLLADMCRPSPFVSELIRLVQPESGAGPHNHNDSLAMTPPWPASPVLRRLC